LPWLVLCLGVIIAVLAITLDGGRSMEARRIAQATADASALAAASDLYMNYWIYNGLDAPGSAQASALSVASSNGMPISAVTVRIPPQSGDFTGIPGYVEVLIDENIPASFGAALGTSQVHVSARSVAKGLPMAIGMIALRPGGADAFRNESPAFTLVNGNVYVNSSDTSALTQIAPGVVLAKQFNIVGGMQNPGGAIVLGKMRTGVPPIADPLALLPAPDVFNGPVRSTSPLVLKSLLPTVLQPGTYQGGISIQGVSLVTMMPGTYVIQGGGLQIQDFATVLGVEVLIYNTDGPGYAAGPVSVASSGKIVLVPPQSGMYQGIGLFQDRRFSNPISLTGSGLSTITGVIYAPRAPAVLTGAAAVGLDILGGAYVVDSMLIKGVGAINVNLNLNPPRIPDVRLVE
jgi:hypothetical protein